MKRPLLFLAIFTLFFLVGWFTIAYLTTPTGNKGEYNSANIALFFTFFFGSATLLTTFAVAAYKSLRPNRKLPPLLIKDSLNHGCIIGTWLTGLLMLQLLKTATVINLVLWVIILVSTEWFWFRYRHNPNQVENKHENK